MKPIIMKAFDKKYKVKTGISIIGNTEQCNIQVPLPECFKLNYDSNILWIQPIINIHRINGQGDAQLLRIDKEYELDLTTGQKHIIVQEQTLTFEYVKPKSIKINLIKQNKPNLTIIEPSINKKIQNESNDQPLTNSQKSKTQPKHYLLVQNYIKQLNGEYRIKFSNFAVCNDDLLKLLKMGIYVDIEQYNILVMETFKRTFNLLLAINEGKMIVNSQWIKDCLSTMQIQNPYLYVLKKNNLSILNSIETSLSQSIFLNKQFNLSQDLKSNLKNEEIIQLIEAGGGSIGNGENSIKIVNNGEAGGLEIEQLLQMILFQRV
ncbi:unnamed protein product (macronuclear) [Paramecium tetraurelia]|uniref:BRCT domain-containing protein n=1 Tax=Paramecium tetraurelia TaxID=5888 RepID=A0E437_PARTE|nr:uncharacterized protein GSPATT00023227001 [Paramecium tetraurelia]CAK90054.1 unnamed protein product [Paramecium tetraurelia]|eukprot:XP_001457451.1 hypothetical protein (macronuclear) [Paramecium tetraurelia strain d4-2]